MPSPLNLAPTETAVQMLRYLTSEGRRTRVAVRYTLASLAQLLSLVAVLARRACGERDSERTYPEWAGLRLKRLSIHGSANRRRVLLRVVRACPRVAD